MADPASNPGATIRKPWLERRLELWLFRSRWLLTPIYVGLVLGLAALVWAFLQEVVHDIAHIAGITPREGIVMSLSLVDLSLAANLMVIVILSGYENFVSRIEEGEPEDRPSWMGAIDFSGLKLKLLASIVAISAIALLRAFMQLAEGEPGLSEHTLIWLVALHLVFLVSGVLMALMDLISSHARH